MLFVGSVLTGREKAQILPKMTIFRPKNSKKSEFWASKIKKGQNGANLSKTTIQKTHFPRGGGKCDSFFGQTSLSLSIAIFPKKLSNLTVFAKK